MAAFKRRGVARQLKLGSASNGSLRSSFGTTAGHFFVFVFLFCWRKETFLVWRFCQNFVFVTIVSFASSSFVLASIARVDATACRFTRFMASLSLRYSRSLLLFLLWLHIHEHCGQDKNDDLATAVSMRNAFFFLSRLATPNSDEFPGTTMDALYLHDRVVYKHCVAGATHPSTHF